jgi:nucleotidyltransferase substrate binding protein (TIGR01987 family)
MSSLRKVKDGIQNLRKATNKLNDALLIPKDRELVAEGTIHRFEMVVELLWKTLERVLLYERVRLPIGTPREVMQKGLSTGLLHNPIAWQSLLDKRNTTSHEYLDESFVETSYEEIKTLTPEILIVLELLETRYP